MDWLKNITADIGKMKFPFPISAKKNYLNISEAVENQLGRDGNTI